MYRGSIISVIGGLFGILSMYMLSVGSTSIAMLLIIIGFIFFIIGFQLTRKSHKKLDANNDNDYSRTPNPWEK